MVKKNNFLIFCLFLLVLLSFFSLAKDNSNEKDCVYLFYGKDCSDCGNLSVFTAKLMKNYPSLNRITLEVYQNRDNFKLLQDFFDAYNISPESQGIPAVFISGTYLIGSKSIEQFLEGRIIENKNESCPLPVSEMNVMGIVGNKSPHHVIETISFSMLTKSALAEGFSSFALISFLILLVLFGLLKEKNKILKLGSSFIAAIYFSYYLFGTGIIFSFSIISTIFTKLIAFFGLIVGIILIKEFFSPLHFPEEWKQYSSLISKYITHPVGMFILGLFVSLFANPIKNSAFSVLTFLMADSSTKMIASPYLLYYNLVSLIPLIIILFVLYKVTKIITNQEDQPENKRDEHQEERDMNYSEAQEKQFLKREESDSLRLQKMRKRTSPILNLPKERRNPFKVEKEAQKIHSIRNIPKEKPEYLFEPKTNWPLPVKKEEKKQYPIRNVFKENPSYLEKKIEKPLPVNVKKEEKKQSPIINVPKERKAIPSEDEE